VKVAFPTSGETPDAALDSRFGRALNFFVFDLETGGHEVVDNQQALDSPQGAGIQAAETVVRSGAECLVSGHCGPKAFRVLTAAGVKVYTSDKLTVAEALEAFKAGALSSLVVANVEGHWV
jgi:predicted Fe-Mo cluster-binding NifX family protein